MASEAEIEAAARALAFHARLEHASEKSAEEYAEFGWKQWVESATVALEAAERVRAVS